MFISQISVFAENRPGTMLEITGVLAQNNIDIRALSLADTTQFGILRLIVDDPEKAHALLQEAKFTVSMTKVIAVKIEDTPGGLYKTLQALQDANLNVEYAYAFITRNAHAAIVILRIEDAEKATAALSHAGVALLSPEEVYQM